MGCSAKDTTSRSMGSAKMLSPASVVSGVVLKADELDEADWDSRLRACLRAKRDFLGREDEKEVDDESFTPGSADESIGPIILILSRSPSSFSSKLGMIDSGNTSKGVGSTSTISTRETSVCGLRMTLADGLCLELMNLDYLIYEKNEDE